MKSTLFLLSLYVFSLSLQSCASIGLAPGKKPLSDQEISDAFSHLSREDLKAETFFGTGQLIVEGRDSYSKAPILFIGRRHPLELRIEITHPWGKPLANMLVRKNGFLLVAFQESKYYVGDGAAMSRQGLLPLQLSPVELWGVARGYPFLEGFKPVFDGIPDGIGLKGEYGKVIRLDGLNPVSALLPEKEVEIAYDGLASGVGVAFAKEIRITSIRDGLTVTVKREQMEVNTALSDDIFRIEIPEGYEKVNIRNSPGKPDSPRPDDSDGL